MAQVAEDLMEISGLMEADGLVGQARELRKLTGQTVETPTRHREQE